MIRYLLSLVLVAICIVSVYGGYDCRRNAMECKNGGLCDTTTGECGCVGTFEGYDCGLNTASKCADQPGTCLNGSICYETTKCYCASGFVGALCNESYAQVMCDSPTSSMIVTLYMEASFAGIVHVAGKLPGECDFSFDDNDDANAKKVINDSNTYEPENEAARSCKTPTEETAEDGSQFYQLKIVAQYHPSFTTSLDELFTIKCLLGAEAQMFGIIKEVNYTQDDLSDVEAEEELSPVVMKMLGSDNNPLSNSLHVGERFSITFTLIDTSIFKTLLITTCTANDTNNNPDEMISITFLNESCPDGPGASIMGLQSATTDDNGKPQVKLPMLAFKFITSDQVGFKCVIKMCKEEDTSCAVPACAGYTRGSGGGGEPPGNAANSTLADGGGNGNNSTSRRKRGASKEEQVSGVLTVIDPYGSKTDVQGGGDPPADGGDDRPADGGDNPPADSGGDPPADGGDNPPADSGGDPPADGGDNPPADSGGHPPAVGGPNQVVCDSEMDIMALLVVMACAIFILFITSLILGLKVIRAKTKIRQCDIELDKSDRPKFQIPRAKLWSTSKI